MIKNLLFDICCSMAVGWYNSAHCIQTTFL